MIVFLHIKSTKMLNLFMRRICAAFVLLILIGHTSRADSPLEIGWATDLIKHQILPEKLETVLRKLSLVCREEVETPIRECLKDYGERTARHGENVELLNGDSIGEEQKGSRVGCCHVWQYDNCVVSAVRTRARVDIAEGTCTEIDVFNTERILEMSSADPKFLQICKGYHRGSRLCAYEPIDAWLLILVWVVGGVAVVIAFSGAICMLYLFVTTSPSRARMPRIFIVRTKSDRKRLIDENFDP